MKVQKATKRDLDAIYKVQPEAFEQSVIVPHNLTEEEIRNLSQAALEDGASYYVLTQDTTVMGYIMIAVKKDSLTAKNFGFIYELYVMREFRQRGYGKKLLTYAIQDFKQLGYDDIRLNVYVDNEAKQLYESIGFEERNTTMQLKL